MVKFFQTGQLVRREPIFEEISESQSLINEFLSSNKAGSLSAIWYFHRMNLHPVLSFRIDNICTITTEQTVTPEKHQIYIYILKHMCKKPIRLDGTPIRSPSIQSVATFIMCPSKGRE